MFSDASQRQFIALEQIISLQSIACSLDFSNNVFYFKCNSHDDVLVRINLILLQIQFCFVLCV